MGATFSRVKNWVAETLTYADLNAEIDNILTNLTTAGVDDYSTNASQMQTATDPGESGTESLPTSLAGELERIRFVLKEIKGTDVSYWYETANTSLSELVAAFGSNLIANRIISGRVKSSSAQPIYLQPDGSAATIHLRAAVTSFVYYVEGTQYTISSNINVQGLTVAPSTNNTCLVNMPDIADLDWTKYFGEYGSAITVDNMGSELTSLTGKLVGLKLDNGSTNEYFIGRIVSSTVIDEVTRGTYLSSGDSNFARIAFNNNDTIQLMKLTWVYAKTDGTLAVSYTNPFVQASQPSSPAIGDYWFDTSADKWKLYNLSSQWVDADALLIGTCMQDTTNCIAARSLDFFKNYESTNTFTIERASATQVQTISHRNQISVYGNYFDFSPARVTWDITTDLASGLTETASTLYFLYITDTGLPLISDEAPRDRRTDLYGFYHPDEPYRCVGQFFNDASSNIVAVIDYSDMTVTNFKITNSVSSNELTLRVHANPFARYPLDDHSTTVVTTKLQILPSTSYKIDSGSTYGHADATNHSMYIFLYAYSQALMLGATTTKKERGSSQSITAETGSGGSDSNRANYGTVAASNVSIYNLARAVSNQTTAGTWASALSSLQHYDDLPDTVSCRYTTAAGQSIGSAGAGATKVNYGTKEWDTHNAVSNAASDWVFTAPKTGKYRITAWNKYADGGFSADTTQRMFIEEGGVQSQYIGWAHIEVTDGNTANVALGGTTLVSMAAGDTIEIDLENDEATARSLETDADYNWVEIEEVHQNTT